MNSKSYSPAKSMFCRPQWLRDWPKLGQEEEHFEAKKWQKYIAEDLDFQAIRSEVDPMLRYLEWLVNSKN